MRGFHAGLTVVAALWLADLNRSAAGECCKPVCRRGLCSHGDCHAAPPRGRVVQSMAFDVVSQRQLRSEDFEEQLDDNLEQFRALRDELDRVRDIVNRSQLDRRCDGESGKTPVRDAKAPDSAPKSLSAPEACSTQSAATKDELESLNRGMRELLEVVTRLHQQTKEHEKRLEELNSRAD